MVELGQRVLQPAHSLQEKRAVVACIDKTRQCAQRLVEVKEGGLEIARQIQEVGEVVVDLRVGGSEPQRAFEGAAARFQVPPLLLHQRQQVQHRRVISRKPLHLDQIGARGIRLPGRERAFGAREEAVDVQGLHAADNGG